ncbi:hypothetical protein D5272_08260 [bacterium D16-76]|nr:hypothetical protein [bacterium D16-76]
MQPARVLLCVNLLNLNYLMDFLKKINFNIDKINNAAYTVKNKKDAPRKTPRRGPNAGHRASPKRGKRSVGGPGGCCTPLERSMG